MSTVLITGAGGYIGSHLTRAFSDHGWGVKALVREPVPWLSVEQTRVELEHPQQDVTLPALLRSVDTVVHLAGENEVTAASNPDAALISTVLATERVAQACAKASVKRLVYVSTVHVYGARVAPEVTLTEDMRPEPRSAYGISRLTSEHVAASMSDGGYDLVVLRLTNSVGAPYDPRVDRWTLVANDLCRQGVLTGRLQLLSSGVQWRDFVPLRDVCSALVAASASDGEVAPGTYNVGSGRPRTIRELAGMIQDSFEQQTGHRPPLVAPEPAGPPPRPYHVSVQRAAEQGLRLDSPLEEAIAETVSFCARNESRLR